MKYVLVSTNNVRRYMAAAEALEMRLTDREVMGMGLVYGRPGLGKTMWLEYYKSQMAKREGHVRAFLVRALEIWTEASMLKDLLAAIGQTPRQYRKDAMFDQLIEDLTNLPAIFIIDEIDSIAESRRLIAVLKDLNDITGSAILMVGEQRVDGLLRRYEAFYNRLNTSAIVNVSGHSAADVEAVITQRCDVAVDADVCREIYDAVGKSMRSVIDQIRAMERISRNNGWKRVGLAEYRVMGHQKPARRRAGKQATDGQVSLPLDTEAQDGLAIAGGGHA